MITQGKYGHRLYYDPTTKCFVFKSVIQVAMYCHLDDTFRDILAFYHMIIIQAATMIMETW